MAGWHDLEIVSTLLPSAHVSHPQTPGSPFREVLVHEFAQVSLLTNSFQEVHMLILFQGVTSEFVSRSDKCEFVSRFSDHLMVQMEDWQTLLSQVREDK